MKRELFGLMLVSAASLLFSGCAIQQSPERQAKLSELQRTIPTCYGERDCEAKWEAAQLWIVHHAGYKLQTTTNVLLETYNPSRSSTAIAVQVTKEPEGGGRYKMPVKIWCDNMFGCLPDSLDAALDFNRTVAAAAP